MSETLYLTRGVRSGPDDAISEEEMIQSGELTKYSEAIPENSTDLLVAATIDISQLKAVFIMVDQDMILETNDGSTPDDTFTLKANVPLIWSVDDPLPNPFSEDITALYLTNTTAGTFTARFLEDPTV